MSSKPMNRPLSPHLQVWKWAINMLMSILHRASGIALVAGMLMLVWMLVAAASGEMAYETFLNFSQSIIGQIMLFGWTGALYFHMFSGIRHLIMDMGYLVTIPQSDKAAKIIIIAAIAMTLATWGALKLSNGGM